MLNPKLPEGGKRFGAGALLSELRRTAHMPECLLQQTEPLRMRDESEDQ